VSASRRLKGAFSLNTTLNVKLRALCTVESFLHGVV